jgi:hypothetical protein
VDVRGEQAAERLEQGDALDPERADVTEDDLLRLFGSQHVAWRSI